MILRVAFASPSVDDLTAGSTQQQLCRLARQIHENCWVFFDSEASRAAFLQQLTREAAPQLADLWSTLLKDRRRCRIIGTAAPALDEDLDVPRLALWAEHSDVVAVPGYQFDLLIDSSLPDHPELCRARELAITQAFERLERARRDPFRRGTPRESVWKERFDIPSRNARTVFLVDKHVGEQVHRSRAEGSRWFIGQLSRYSIQNLIIATDLPKDCKPAELEESFRRFVADVQPSFEVRLLPVYSGKWPIHARHIRFDTDIAFQLEKGLDTFAHDPFDQTYPCNWVDPEDALDDYRTVKGLARYQPKGLTLG